MSIIDKYITDVKPSVKIYEIDKLRDQIKSADNNFQNIQKRYEKLHRQLLSESAKRNQVLLKDTLEKNRKSSASVDEQILGVDPLSSQSSYTGINNIHEIDEKTVAERTQMLGLMKKMGIEDPSHFVRNDVFKDSIQSSYEDNISSIASQCNPGKLVEHIPSYIRRPAFAFMRLYLLTAVCLFYSKSFINIILYI